MRRLLDDSPKHPAHRNAPAGCSASSSARNRCTTPRCAGHRTRRSPSARPPPRSSCAATTGSATSNTSQVSEIDGAPGRRRLRRLRHPDAPRRGPGSLGAAASSSGKAGALATTHRRARSSSTSRRRCAMLDARRRPATPRPLVGAADLDPRVRRVVVSLPSTPDGRRRPQHGGWTSPSVARHVTLTRRDGLFVREEHHGHAPDDGRTARVVAARQLRDRTAAVDATTCTCSEASPPQPEGRTPLRERRSS